MPAAHSLAPKETIFMKVLEPYTLALVFPGKVADTLRTYFQDRGLPPNFRHTSDVMECTATVVNKGIPAVIPAAGYLEDLALVQKNIQNFPLDLSFCLTIKKDLHPQAPIRQIYDFFQRQFSC